MTFFVDILDHNNFFFFILIYFFNEGINPFLQDGQYGEYEEGKILGLFFCKLRSNHYFISVI